MLVAKRSSLVAVTIQVCARKLAFPVKARECICATQARWACKGLGLYSLGSCHGRFTLTGNLLCADFTLDTRQGRSRIHIKRLRGLKRCSNVRFDRAFCFVGRTSRSRRCRNLSWFVLHGRKWRLRLTVYNTNSRAAILIGTTITKIDSRIARRYTARTGCFMSRKRVADTCTCIEPLIAAEDSQLQSVVQDRVTVSKKRLTRRQSTARPVLRTDRSSSSRN